MNEDPKPDRSAAEESERLAQEGALYVLAALILVIFAAHDWLRWYLRLPPAPAVITAVAIGACVYAVKKAGPRWRNPREPGRGLGGAAPTLSPAKDPSGPTAEDSPPLGTLDPERKNPRVLSYPLDGHEKDGRAVVSGAPGLDRGGPGDDVA